MENKNTHFPQYRKLSNGQRFYKILGWDAFEELTIMGSSVLYFKVEAKQYPEKLRILDMVELKDDAYEMSSESEFEKLNRN